MLAKTFLINCWTRLHSSREIICLSWKITWNLLFISFQSASPRWEPQISILCEAGQQYLPQYLSEDGRWTSELGVKVPGVSCIRDKMDLLDYCKKVSQVQIFILRQQRRQLKTWELLINRVNQLIWTPWKIQLKYSNLISSLVITVCCCCYEREIITSQQQATKGHKVSNTNPNRILWEIYFQFPFVFPMQTLSSPQIECQTANKALNFKFQHKAERVWVVKREKQFPFSAVSNPPSYDFTHRIHLTPERSRWLSKIAIEDGGRGKVVGCQHGGENVESFRVWL